MFRTQIFSRNGIEAYGETNPISGVRSYTVTDPRTGTSFTNTIAALVIAKANELANRPAVKQIESPLPATERSASMLAGGAGAANHLSDPAARKLAEGIAMGGVLRRGTNDKYGYADLRMLKSLARRRWVTLDHAVRPTRATATKAGVRALSAAILPDVR